MEFLLNFTKVFSGIIEIFLIVSVGVFFSKLKLVDKQGLRTLSALTINLFLPCLIFNHLIHYFSFSSPRDWWLYPLMGVCIPALGFIVGSVICAMDKSIKEKDEFICLISFQNCGYLPLLLVAAIYPNDIAREMFTRIFLFIQGFNVVFWGFGIQFLYPGEPKFQFKKIFSPPFAALIISMLFIAANLKPFMPTVLMRVTELLGNCTLPVALLSLGIILAEVMSTQVIIRKSFFVKVLFGKLIVMPVIVLGIISILKLTGFIALILFIEAVMPSAINLGVVSVYQKAKYDLIGRALLVTYLFAVVSIPFFMALLSLVYKI
ncbi:MAG: AEC family transporter [Candidatus Omnitrophota bacterium]